MFTFVSKQIIIQIVHAVYIYKCIHEQQQQQLLKKNNNNYHHHQEQNLVAICIMT